MYNVRRMNRIVIHCSRQPFSAGRVILLNFGLNHLVTLVKYFK